ncbi:MAG: nucleotidyltransferase [Pirellulales bacterium]|nr:nucleotidyltransferase [Pirellulales bacterium]
MELTDLLRHTADHLDRLGLRYLVTGSVATIAYGEPRFTNDIDIAIELPPERVDEFCAGFSEEDYYVSPAAVAQAAKSRRHFNVIHPAAGYKIDFMVLTDSAFDQSRLGRRTEVAALPDRKVTFASPEDVLIKKMEFYREGGSEKHLRDIAGVLRSGKVSIDSAYMAEWTQKLGLTAIWQEVSQRSQRAP